MKYRPNVEECAKLVAYLMLVAADQAGKEHSRARLTEKSMRIVCGRQRLRGAFIDELSTALLDYGWVLMEGSRFFGLVRETTLEGWTRISSAPIAETIRELRNSGGDYDFEDIDERIDLPDDNDEAA